MQGTELEGEALNSRRKLLDKVIEKSVFQSNENLEIKFSLLE